MGIKKGKNGSNQRTLLRRSNFLLANVWASWNYTGASLCVNGIVGRES